LPDTVPSVVPRRQAIAVDWRLGAVVTAVGALREDRIQRSMADVVGVVEQTQ
jgi:hypothetical protein